MSLYLFLSAAVSHVPSFVRAYTTKRLESVSVGTEVFMAGGWKIVITEVHAGKNACYTAATVDLENKLSKTFKCWLLAKGNHFEVPPCFFTDKYGVDLSRGTSHLWQIHINFRNGGRVDWRVTPKFWARGCGHKPCFRSKTGMVSFHKWSSIPKSQEEAASSSGGASSAASSSGGAPAAASSSGGASSGAFAPAPAVQASAAVSTAPNVIVVSVTDGKDSVCVKIKDTIRVYKITQAYESRFRRSGLCLCAGNIKLHPTCRVRNPQPLHAADGSIAAICDGDELTVVSNNARPIFH